VRNAMTFFFNLPFFKKKKTAHINKIVTKDYDHEAWC